MDKLMNSLIVIAGPTATGKTKTAVLTAKALHSEIISADSMQLYKYMDIGTAKPTTEETQGIKHYMIDEVDPNTDFSVATFNKLATQYISELHSSGKVPILAGGTGFYINSVIYGNHFDRGGANAEYREWLHKEAIEQGSAYLHAKLADVDPESAEAIHPNNIKRVIRALEFYEQTGVRISEHNKSERLREPLYNTLFFVLTMERGLLYERIERRVDMMFANGLVDEVTHLLKMGVSDKAVSMQGIGYKEVAAYINGCYSYEDTVNIVKLNTRHYAKRQLTWFSGQVKDAVWISIDKYSFDYDAITQLILKNVEERLFIH